MMVLGELAEGQLAEGELADIRFFVKTIDFHTLKFLPVNPAIQTHQKT